MSPVQRPSKARVSGIQRAAVGPVLQSPTDSDTVPTAQNEGTAYQAEVSHRPVREAPTRITVDLVSELHVFLRSYAQERDVAAADVIRELIRQLRSDPELSTGVTAELLRRKEALAEAMRAARE